MSEELVFKKIKPGTTRKLIESINDNYDAIGEYIDKRAFEKTIGDGVNSSITVLHNLNSTGVIPTVWSNIAPFVQMDFQAEIIDLDNIKFTFDSIPAENSLHVVLSTVDTAYASPIFEARVLSLEEKMPLKANLEYVDGKLDTKLDKTTHDQFASDVNDDFESVMGYVSNNTSTINAEIERATQAESLKANTSDVNGKNDLQDADIETRATKTELNTEVQRAEDAEQALNDLISGEKSRAEGAENSIVINQEQINSSLSSVINTNSQSIETKADKTALQSEITRATSSESANAQSISANADNISTNTTSIANEILRAKGAENANATNITKKVNTSDIYDGLNSTAIDKPLSANMGKVISQKLTEIENSIQTRIYGFDYDELTGDVTRLENAVGLTIGTPDGTGAIASDFDSIYPWSDIRHVKVEADGVIIEQSDDDYATSDGEIMTYIPQFYYKDDRKNGHRYCYISNKKFADYTKAWQDKEYGLIGSFDASLVDGEYRSRVGEVPKTSVSYTGFITDFYAKGDGKWSMYDSNMLHNLFLLSCIEAGSINHKASYGRGINGGMPYSSSDSYKLVSDTINGNTVTIIDAGQPFYVGMTVQVGSSYTNNSKAQNRLITNIATVGSNLEITLGGDAFDAVIGDVIASWGQPVPQAQYDALGDGSGYILQGESSNRSHVCYRGIWDLWGNVWQFIAGFMRYDGRYYGCCEKAKYSITDPRGADGWTDLGIGEYADNGYQKIREAIKIDGGSIDVPIECGSVASSETFYSAYLYNFSSSYTGTRVLLVGGSWGNGSYVSLVCSSGSNTPSSSYVGVGARFIR